MDIGIGLPTTIPGAAGSDLVRWARRAESTGFSTLGALDRFVYDNYEPLTALSVAAGATERIRLATTILIAAYRDSAALLAKQTASLQRLSGNRLVLGVAAGGRADDYEANGTSYEDRGRRLDTMLDEIRQVWLATGRWGDVGPAPDPPPPLIVGGHSPAAMRRVARHGAGWIAGGSSAAGFAVLAAQARQAWTDAGRGGAPRTYALAYVSLGRDGRSAAEQYLRRYYAFIGEKADRAAAGVITDGSQLQDLRAAYAAAGCDELLLFPCVADPDQVDLIAKDALS
ncbi:LLM class flavin-dependent oxidoreductase [Micromonospora sp. LOL_015]|uniref:LLM class flavin-dependent oxidoreductase n=1 Tax=Micromonospora sp. LOL_015 TaxID=3345416 RepID=UPI003A87D293